MLDIKGMDKAKILAELYNAANSIDIDIIKHDATTMSIEEAKELLKKQKYFNVINGRILKVDLRSDILDTYLYDRNNGKGSGYKVWKKIKYN